MKKKTKENSINEVLINERLIKASKMKSDDLLFAMRTSLNGYSDEELEELLDKYGENIISHGKTGALRSITPVCVGTMQKYGHRERNVGSKLPNCSR